MSFAKRLPELRKKKQISQNVLAAEVGIHVSQLRRYEAGTSQPTLDVLRNLASTLNCTTDELIFGLDQRQPSQDLLLLFEAVSSMDEEEKKIVKEVLESLILRHQAKRWTQAS